MFEVGLHVGWRDNFTYVVIGIHYYVWVCKILAVELSEGDMFVVPKGVEHKPWAENECKIMIIEPRGVVNTGNSEGDLTASNDVWI